MGRDKDLIFIHSQSAAYLIKQCDVLIQRVLESVAIVVMHFKLFLLFFFLLSSAD